MSNKPQKQKINSEYSIVINIANTIKCEFNYIVRLKENYTNHEIK